MDTKTKTNNEGGTPPNVPKPKAATTPQVVDRNLWMDQDAYEGLATLALEEIQSLSDEDAEMISVQTEEAESLMSDESTLKYQLGSQSSDEDSNGSIMELEGSDKDPKGSDKDPTGSDKDLTPSHTEDSEKNPEGADADLLDKPQKRLSGAAKKRLKWLIKKGHDPLEARMLALQPIRREKREKGTKRNRSEDSTPKAAEAKRIRTQPVAEATATARKEEQPRIRTAPKHLSYKQVAEGVRMGILSANFPEDMLSTEKIKAIQKAILMKILEIQGDEIKPSFLGSSIRPGWLLLTCTDKATSEWLQKAVGEIKPWEGANLKAVEEDQIPRSKVLVGYFPDSTDSTADEILKFVSIQNRGLNVTEWRVLRRATEGPVSQITLSVDYCSAERLKEIAFRVNYKFGQVQLRPKGDLKMPKEHGRNVGASISGGATTKTAQGPTGLAAAVPSTSGINPETATKPQVADHRTREGDKKGTNVLARKESKPADNLLGSAKVTPSSSKQAIEPTNPAGKLAAANTKPPRKTTVSQGRRGKGSSKRSDGASRQNTRGTNKSPDKSGR